MNQKSQYHWQLVLVTNQSDDSVLKNGVLLLFLQKHFPNIEPNKNYRANLVALSQNDIFGTCLMPQNDKLVAYLKHCCYDNLRGIDIPEWDFVLDSVSTTSCASVYAYLKTIPLSNQKRLFLNAYITKQRTQEFDNEIFIAKTKERLKVNKSISDWISFQSNRRSNN